MKKIDYINRIDGITSLTLEDHVQLKQVTEKYDFRSNDYYLSLIDWSDPLDPIRQMIIPDIGELQEWGKFDPSNESNYTIIPGLQQKYSSTALLLVSNVCGGICRYCFRKRIFIRKETDILKDLPAALNYISEHKEITNVLLTGGDPLMLTTNKLENIIKQLFNIPHISIVRIGTKLLSFNPYRILDDKSFLEMLRKYNCKDRKIYIMSHFSHINEVTDVAIDAVEQLLKTGVMILNQTPIIKGVNDSSAVLSGLFQKLSCIGIAPYYLFQCRPSLGNKCYAVTIERAYRIFEGAKELLSGLAKRARFVLSHSTGKLEIIGLTDKHIYFKYFRAADVQNSGQFMAFKRNPKAYWFDDYTEVVEDSHPFQQKMMPLNNEASIIS